MNMHIDDVNTRLDELDVEINSLELAAEARWNRLNSARKDWNAGLISINEFNAALNAVISVTHINEALSAAYKEHSRLWTIWHEHDKKSREGMA